MNLVTGAQIAQAVWFALAWTLILTAAGLFSLARWYRHEHEDADHTTTVMRSLKADTSHAHERDIL
jgi:hypothetical protein